MAKADNVSLLEQHVEKLVLLVCLVLLGIALSRWVFSSPVSMTVISPTVSDRGRERKSGVLPPTSSG